MFQRNYVLSLKGRETRRMRRGRPCTPSSHWLTIRRDQARALLYWRLRGCATFMFCFSVIDSVKYNA
jgi:hypothetical protein